MGDRRQRANGVAKIPRTKTRKPAATKIRGAAIGGLFRNVCGYRGSNPRLNPAHGQGGTKI